MLIDFKITFKLMNYNMEHCHGDYEKMSLIQKLCSDNLYDNLKPEQHYLLNKFKHSVLPKKNLLAIMRFGFFILSVNSSISSILLY